jgi:hypothetical protein
LPDSSFIIVEQSKNAPPGGSVAGMEQNIALKAEAMKLAKLREYEDKKEAALAEKLKKAADAKQLQ